MKVCFSTRLPRRVIWLGALLVSGCATYHSKPLPSGPDLAQSPALTVPASRFNPPGLAPHKIDAANGLDETTLVTLAVLNNPDLKAARLQSGVAAAQVLEAGLLPDPQVSGGLSRSSLHTGYSIALGEDLQALITRGAAKAAAGAHARQVNLDILWQEWQVAEKARELFIQARAQNRLDSVLSTNRNLLEERYNRDHDALERNLVGAAVVSADFMALTDVGAQLRQLELEKNQTHHALNQLLGLSPATRLRLAGRQETCLLSDREFETALAALPHRRADLLALQAGYQSQQQRLREAILAQFPDLSAGVQQARSAEEGVHTIGLTVNVTLPIFNRNRGRIALQRATRAALYQAYQARLDQAAGEAHQMWAATRILARQSRDLEGRLPALRTAAAAAEKNFKKGNLNLQDYASLESNFLIAQADAIRLRSESEQAQSALITLLGLPSGAPAAGPH